MEFFLSVESIFHLHHLLHLLHYLSQLHHLNDHLGVHVADPCQAVDSAAHKSDLIQIHISIKDLKYHDGTDSPFWLSNFLQIDRSRMPKKVEIFSITTVFVNFSSFLI
jgi:hypothetical protein